MAHGNSYPAALFRRQDESDDRLFYSMPRLVVHVDEPAIKAITGYLTAELPGNGAVLDLMSSWRSHLPTVVPFSAVTGVGLNVTELAENPQLTKRLVHDVNQDPRLPLPDASFDAAMITVSIQYITQPVALFRDVARVLKPDASLSVIYSNRMFPTKAVAVWHALDMDQRSELIASYFVNSGAWGTAEFADISPSPFGESDPVRVVSARRKAV